MSPTLFAPLYTGDTSTTSSSIHGYHAASCTVCLWLAAEEASAMFPTVSSASVALGTVDDDQESVYDARRKYSQARYSPYVGKGVPSTAQVRVDRCVDGVRALLNLPRRTVRSEHKREAAKAHARAQRHLQPSAARLFFTNVRDHLVQWTTGR